MSGPRRRLAAILLALLAALALSACGSSGGKQGSKSSSGTTSPTTAATGPRAAATPPKPASCHAAKVPPPRPEGKLHAPTQKLDPSKRYFVVFDTTCGTFTIKLDVKDAPRTTASFAYLVKQHFYDDTIFHRIVAGFVIQGGDPRGTGTGGPGYKVVEPPPQSLRYTRGTVAMAKGQTEAPGTSGSQFYIVTALDAQLPPEYALVGRVVAGQPVVDAMGILPVDASNPDPNLQERPIHPPVVRSARLIVK